ncbi:MATE family efflux transporter [Heyndrickxia oleronia]|uniref:MATE family efflux transporter n=1 Tax=Heyndrickxia oleronia TaxID=38875 RepID=UPI00242E49DC|nr:MATE family efflux transporter [Heyndrickxia oleronia]MCI1590816.1 MATE family efflux transporter [Heyndrickxia oleronia]MCI1612827.1 MATE family efflux transporter [Heyndrickxia oleronia]MCI1744053.1 MATE family efflux transporter [Heyndrickxia oleronia]MCI1761664.1 MATE family efflux transporter [Heyndrickxia oleronia]
MSTNKLQEQTLFNITWPLLIELTLHMGMGIMATLMLSHYSDDAASGVGVANQLLNIFILVFTVTSIGATVLISQSLGAENFKKARQLSRSVFGLNFWFGMIIALIVFFFGEHLLRLFDIEGKVFDYGLIFVRICGASLFLESLSLALSAVLRSHGFTKESMVVTVIMDLISIGGNILATTGILGLPITGVVGVSWAIVVARSFAVLALIYFVYKRLSLRLTFSDLFKAKKEDVKSLLSIGIPSAGENLSYQLSQLVITGFVVTIGTSALASRIYLLNLSMICYLFTLAIAQGTQLLVARYIGGKQYERALRRGVRTLKIAMIASFIASLILALIGSPILSIFTDDPKIIAIGLPVLWAIVITEPGRAMNIVLMSSLKSAGDVRFPVIIGMISMWGIAVVLSYVLGVHFGLGLLGIWIAQGADEWFRGCFAFRRWLSKPWERKVAKIKMKALKTS